MNHLSSGDKAKARDIITAIRILNMVEREQRPATDDEMQALRKFGGFGAVALSIFPNPQTGQFKDGWQEIGEELKSLLTPAEYDSAKRTTFTAFYTSPIVIASIHDAVSRLGIPANATVLEPGCGNGSFMTGQHRYIGVEQDSISGRIARVLHPGADIRIEDFQQTKLPPLDAAIGNVPFANIQLDLNGQKLSLHDYFIAKSVDALKPGGILAVVTSHYTMDKQNAAARERLAGQADFLGAIRLPSDAFKREGTAVVTDIVFFRKRSPGQEPNHVDPSWMETGSLKVDDSTVAVNRYFLSHPEMVLGTWSSKDTLYGGEGYSILSNGDLASQLSMAVKRLPRFEPQMVEAQRATPPPVFVPPPPLRHISEGSFFVGDDKVIRQMVDGQATPVDYGGAIQRADGTLIGKRMAALIGLRDHARRALQSQNEGWPEQNRQQARQALNFAYDRFVAAYGPINKTTITATKDDGQIRRMPNLVKFREDPDAMLVMSLEEYDEATGKAEKSAIMKQDVVGPKPPITHVTSAEEGLLVSLDHKGAIDLPYIESLYQKPAAQIITELGDLIYCDPMSKEWQTADAYLSGNVREKLVTAERAGPEYARNAEALRQVQPEDVLPGDIDANLGAPWIPASDIQAFAADLFGVPTESIKIGHIQKDALWSVEPDYRTTNSVAATADYGTSRINGTTLLDQALNLKSPVIYDTIHHGDREEKVVNQTETLAAKEKQRQIKEKFKSWIFSDPDRTERLVRDYNDAFNNLRPRLFDGSHLDFPGMSKAVTLNPHQRAAVWRCMTGGNTLLAHCVGAGKTFEVVAAAMKMKQAGLINKPMVACPNHMLEQFSREWLQLYPNAKILIASKEDFDKDKRKFLTAKIATGDWDGIIVTHSSFERIGMSREFQEEFLSNQIAEYESMLIDRSAKGRNIIKTLEKQKANRVQKLKDLQAKDKKDDGLVFDELGVDQLFIDECFTYDTVIETDRGPLKIGDIVTNRLTVKVKSVNSSTHAVEWKPVVRWFANKRRHPLIEVFHEAGSFISTTRHKIWVDGVGYKRAGTLGQSDLLLRLSHQGLRKLQSAVHTPERWKGQRCEEATALLLSHMQDEGAAGESTFGSQVQGCNALDLGKFTTEGKAKSVGIIADEAGQPHVQSGSEGESICFSQGNRAQAPGSRRERPFNGAAGDAREEDRNDYRIGNQHSAHSTSDGVASEALQSGFGRHRQQGSSRVGRQYPPLCDCETEGCEKGTSLIPSRVARVAFLEPDGDGEYRFGGREHSVVYDIEVADNHNYFANGILVSNCHAYKNLETPTKMERVAGIQTGGSERAYDLLMKSLYLDGKHPGHGLIGASGTPISNSMVEMYTMQRFFDHHALKKRSIEHFDGWAATFGETVDTMEISPDGATLKPRSRFAKFVNLPELIQMFRSFADVQTAEMLNLPRPKLAGGKAQTVACPMSDEQHELQGKLIERYERIRSTKVDPRVDNALAITTDGRKLALDGRMLGAGGDFPGSKINELVRNVVRIWKKTEDNRGTQMVFCDMGVHPNPFSAYDEIASKLEDHGMPSSQVAIMGDADTDAKKQALFEKVRQGTVRVLIGSTAKMGTGTNVQKRLVALHHLDAPWKPAEVEQRDGRILRQGNMNEEVSIYRYVTEGSFDAYMWQALETKARFIAQVMTGDCAVRKAEDIGGQELSYAEVKAIASGNPAVLTLAETDAELQRLAILKKNHADEQYLARRSVKELPERIRSLSNRLTNLTQDMDTLKTHEQDPITIANREFPPADAQAVLGKRLEALPQEVKETRTFPLGKYRGLAFGLIRHSLGRDEAYLEGGITRRIDFANDNPGPRAVLNALERLANSYGAERDRCQQDLSVSEGQLQDYSGRIGKAFPHEEYRAKLTDLRDRLKVGLSDKAPEGEGPSVAQLAEQIQALRAATTVDAAPQRAGAKAARAEQPVTARIRANASQKVQAEPMVEEMTVQPMATVIEMPKAEQIPEPSHAQQVVQGRKYKQMNLF